MILRPLVAAGAALALFTLLGTARAQEEGDHDHEHEDESSWEDPTLEDALAQAKYVARAHADADMKPDAPTIVIDDVVAGEATKGAKVVLHNAANAVAQKYLALSPLAPGEDSFFIVREATASEDGGKIRSFLPSPTFGRFPVKDGKVVACPRDSFVRVTMKAEDYAAFLKNAFEKAKGRKVDQAWLTAQREALKKLDATSVETVDAAHVALEAVTLGADASDAELGLRFFASPRFQIRISAARLLEKAGGERAAEGLLRLATSDEDPAVRSSAIAATVRVKPQPKDAAKTLVAHLREQSAASIRVQNADDPRTNEYAAPLAASFDAIRDLGAGPDATPIAIELLARDDAEVIATACLHLTQVTPAPSIAEIVDKLRPKDYQFQGLNELITNCLNHITGESLPPDRDQWKTYLANRDK